MKKSLLSALAISAAVAANARQKLGPPRAKATPVVDTLHNLTYHPPHGYSEHGNGQSTRQYIDSRAFVFEYVINKLGM